MHGGVTALPHRLAGKTLTRTYGCSGVIRRGSRRWKRLANGKRQAGERVFKSVKESRRLERQSAGPAPGHPFTPVMSCLAFQATVLARMQAGETARMRWMVRAVA